MNNYLAKPVKPNTLKALLESYLSKEDGGTPERPKTDAPDTSAVKDKSDQATTNGATAEKTSKDRETTEKTTKDVEEPTLKEATNEP
jgi:hypothetical protein